MCLAFPRILFPPVFIAFLVSALATISFAQLSSEKPAGISARQPIPISANQSEPNEFRTEPKKTAPNKELIAANSEKSETDFSVAKSLSDLRQESTLKSFRESDTNARPVMPRRKQGSSGNNDWEFSFAPYLYMTALSGTVGARGRTLEVDMSIGDVLKKFDVGIMGVFEARKGRFVIVSDVFWAKLSEKEDTPGALFSTVKIGVNLFILDPEAGYRVIDSDRGSLDVLGGVRIWSVENNLNVTTGILQGFDVSQRKSWAAPIGGVRGIVNVTPKFFLSGKFDIGGAGVGADLTTQVYAGAGYRITPKIALVGGYRYLQVDYDDSEGFLFDTKMNGIILGAKFSF